MSIHDDTLVSLQQENQRLEVEIDRLRSALDRIAQSNGLASWRQLVTEDDNLAKKASCLPASGQERQKSD